MNHVLKRGNKIITLSSLSVCITLLFNQVSYADPKVDSTSANTNSPFKAMTWTILQTRKLWNKDVYYALVGSDSNTNTYQGDTSISQSLPILCIQKANLPKPVTNPEFIVPFKTPGGADRATWSGGYIGLTAPVQGLTLKNQKIADGICVETFDVGYRMAEFHDGQGDSPGWDFWGKLVNPDINLAGRFWVFINDQPANPWAHQ